MMTFMARHTTLKPSDRPHVFDASGFYDTTGQTCDRCGDVESSPWHWREVDGRLEPPDDRHPAPRR